MVINFHDIARDPLISFILVIPMSILAGYLLGFIIIILEYAASEHITFKDTLHMMRKAITFWNYK
ncbi:hypothetical protein BRC2024_QFGIOCBO_CDS_0135 [Acinetobacter phage vB_AbaM_PhT2-v2]